MWDLHNVYLSDACLRSSSQIQVICFQLRRITSGATSFVLGVCIMSVPHGLDRSILWALCPCYSEVISTSWMNGGQDSLAPSKTIIVCPSQLHRQLDGIRKTEISLMSYCVLIGLIPKF